jgi:SAM-dependent methyltransferase
MEFTSAAEHYDRYMGRYTRTLAPALADAAGVERGMRALDVGCGPGGLTHVLTERLGAESVAAIDPAPQFAEACRERHPGADVRVGAAEELPWEDDSFDAALSCLVVAFMADADQGLREMARVTRPGGVVAASVWGPQGPLSTFWQAVREREPGARDESALAGAREGHLAELFEAAGLRDVEPTVLEVRVEHPTFDEWWQPFTGGVGPSGAYVASLDPAGREELRERCRALLPPEPFTVTARAWAVRGRA